MDDNTFPDAPAAPGAAAAPAAPSKTLDSGRPAPAAGTTTPPSSDPWESIPAKFVVKGTDGELDRDASLAKLSDSYRNLESRLGVESGRPESPDKYALKIPDAIAPALDTESPQFKAFRDEAFGEGLTSRQLQFILDKYAEAAPQLVAGAQALDADAAERELSQVWSDPAVLELNIAHADRAVEQIGKDLGEPLIRAFRNNPAAIQFLARIGAQLQEDTPPAGAGSVPSDDIVALQASEAYRDPRHADHAKVSAKVRAWYGRQPGAAIPL